MKKLLEFDNIMFRPGIGDRLVRVSGVIEEGEIVSLAGASGSGKTTLLRILARLREADGGSVTFGGISWDQFDPAQWRRMVHYLAQKPVVFDGTVQDNLQKPFELAVVKKDFEFDPQVASSLLERLLLPAGLWSQDARTLSGGEAARLTLIRSLLVKPNILLLDEPMAALDEEAASAVMELITEWLEEVPERGVIMVSHSGQLSKLPSISEIKLEVTEGGGTYE